MVKTYRLGATGFAHMHVNTLLLRFPELPASGLADVERVACADTISSVPSLTRKPASHGANLKRAHEVIGIPKVYDDYRVIYHLETGEPLHPTLDMMQNLEVMAILDAGIRSAESGKVELVNDATWCIG